MMLDRRAFLAATGAGLGAAFLAAKPDELQASFAHAARAAREDLPLDHLTPEQAADIGAIASQIIPSDDQLPGAREAGVVNFIDHALGTWAAPQKTLMLMGLGMFNGLVSQQLGTPRFALLTPAQQLQFLQANEQNPLFQQLQFITKAGTFAHPDWGGNRDGAGWRILGFENRYLWQPPFGWYDDRANGGPN